MARLERYISVGQKRLRCGYTTGTCAAAAARGAAERLLTGRWPAAVIVDTPAGVPVEAELLERSGGTDWAACAVRKDGGDDPDATDGALIFVRVERRETPGIENRRLSAPSLPLRRKAEALLYEIGKEILTRYGCFEE